MSSIMIRKMSFLLYCGRLLLYVNVLVWGFTKFASGGEARHWPPGFADLPTEVLHLRDGRKFTGRFNEEQEKLAIIHPVRAVIEIKKYDIVRRERLSVESEEVAVAAVQKLPPILSEDSPLTRKMKEELRVARFKEKATSQSIEESQKKTVALEEHLVKLKAEYDVARVIYEREGGARLGFENPTTYRLKQLYFIASKCGGNLEEEKRKLEDFRLRLMEAQGEIGVLEEDIKSLSAEQSK